ncbi:copper resistance protein NlpE [Shewanella zhangzhouensis]|uniref:copper resistance protein NlpE n=1 Tax=Shewanella zhangzhouensis TaxID=2864213 RepID=UPI001C660A19|nr:copper resistance protein NlpE [Shewanella zhangzhouensis]QYK03902.1 copper resistance protein NlpE [Shewanella zhangzhouensis]
MKLPQLLSGFLLTLPLLACSQAEAPAQAEAPLETEALQAATPSSDKGTTSVKPQNDYAKDALPVGDSSRTSLDWPGSYEGVVPCASCEGINTRLVINGDGTYLLETQYLGEQEAGAEPKVFEERGTFTWNTSGGAIQLESGAWYQVGENQLFMLDRDGKRITGALADHYRLGKQL